MACNVNGANPAPAVCDVTAGSTVMHEWHHENREQAATDGDDPIASSHKGPIMTYLAKVPDAKSERGVTALDWFKIAEDGLKNGVWAVDTLYKEHTGKWSVSMSPKFIKNTLLKNRIGENTNKHPQWRLSP
jgi:cellulase